MIFKICNNHPKRTHTHSMFCQMFSFFSLCSGFSCALFMSEVTVREHVPVCVYIYVCVHVSVSRTSGTEWNVWNYCTARKRLTGMNRPIQKWQHFAVNFAVSFEYFCTKMKWFRDDIFVKAHAISVPTFKFNLNLSILRTFADCKHTFRSIFIDFSISFRVRIRSASFEQLRGLLRNHSLLNSVMLQARKAQSVSLICFYGFW